MKTRYPVYRIRWWNILLYLMIFVLAITMVLPFFNTKYGEGFLGNVIAECWGIPIGALVAWIFFNRFRSERFRNVSPQYSKNIYRLSVLANQLQNCKNDFAKAKLELNDQTRRELQKGADELFRKIAFYSKFLEFDDLENMEHCYTSTIALALLDKGLPDYEFMEQYCKHLCDLYFYSTNVSDRLLNADIYGDLCTSYDCWSKLNLEHRKSMLA